MVQLTSYLLAAAVALTLAEAAPHRHIRDRYAVDEFGREYYPTHAYYHHRHAPAPYRHGHHHSYDYDYDYDYDEQHFEPRFLHRIMEHIPFTRAYKKKQEAKLEQAAAPETA